jgi:hypothetical protein
MVGGFTQRPCSKHICLRRLGDHLLAVLMSKSKAFSSRSSRPVAPFHSGGSPSAPAAAPAVHQRPEAKVHLLFLSDEVSRIPPAAACAGGASGPSATLSMGQMKTPVFDSSAFSVQPPTRMIDPLQDTLYLSS